MKRVTIKDIANSLCISVSTVSRALANDKNIRLETREKIFEEADRMGYRRNHFAACLRSGLTNTIGVITHEMLTPYTAGVLKGIQNVTQQQNINVIIYNSENNSSQEKANILALDHSLADGIIISLCDNSENLDLISRLQNKGVPVVFFANTPSHFDATMVVENAYDKAFYLTDHLICSGRRRIVHLAGPKGILSHDDALRGYRDALVKFNIPVDDQLIIPTDIKPEAGARAIDKLLENNVDFDAVFACNDLPAIGAMNRLREVGKDIPADVSVAGFSGSPLSTMVYPQLTTVEAPLEEVGMKAASLLLHKIEHPEDRNEKITVDTRIRLRASTHDNPN